MPIKRGHSQILFHARPIDLRFQMTEVIALRRIVAALASASPTAKQAP